MQEKFQQASLRHAGISRRDFMRGLGGGALAIGAGHLLAGCGGGSGGAGGGGGNNVPFTLYMSTFLARSVLKYESTSGTLTELIKFPQFADAPTNKKEQTTAGLVVSPDKQNLFVFSPGSDQIFMLDANTGALKRTIKDPVAGAPHAIVNTAHDGVIGPDGRLYYVNAPSLTARVGGAFPDSIEILDPATGDYVGTFIESTTTPELRGPFGLAFGPDGDLYVSSVLSFGFNPKTFPFRPDTIARFDGTTGKFKNFVVRASHLSFTMAFHPNGQLLVPSFFFNRIYNYDPATSRQIDAFANVNYPLQLLYGPDGDLYVTSFSDQAHVDLLTDTISTNDTAAQGEGRLLRFDGNSGRLRGEVLKNLPFGAFLAFA